MPRAEDDDAKVHAKYSDLKAEMWSQNLMAFILIFLIYLIFYPKNALRRLRSDAESDMRSLLSVPAIL